MITLLFSLLPAPDAESFRNVFQAIFTLGMAGLVIGLLTVGAGFTVGYLVYMNATKDRSSESH